MAEPGRELRIYTVFCRPLDYPDEYVVRGCSILPGHDEPVQDAELFTRGPTLGAVRMPLVELGLHRQPREPGDVGSIVEVWF